MNYNDMKMLASELVKSGLAPRDMRNPSQAFVVMVAGSELGIAPMTSVREIVLVKGKVTISSQMMLALSKRAGVSHEWINDSNERVELKLTRKGDEPYTSAFTMQDARSAGLTNSPTYKKFPRPMLRARCVSAAIRAYCPDVLSGVYAHGELDDPIDEPAEHVEARPEETESVERMTLEAFQSWLEPLKCTIEQFDQWYVAKGGKPAAQTDLSSLVERIEANEAVKADLVDFVESANRSADEEVPF